MSNTSIPPDDGEVNPIPNSNGNGADGIRIEDIDVVNDEAPNLSEQAIASEFAARHADTLRYVAPWKKWVIWNGARWEDDDKRQAHTLGDQLCIEMSRLAGKRALTVASAGFRTAVLSLASDNQHLAATVTGWDGDPMLLNTPGCVVDLRTGKWGEAKPEYMMRMMTTVAPAQVRADGSLGCPLWLDFLKQIFNNNDALVKYIQRVCGYCLTGSIEEHQMWFGYGSGQNGKGVFIEVFSRVMGDYHANAEIETFTVNQNLRHTTELARLQGKRLVTSAETEAGRRWAEARIKEVTGGNKITARFMRMDDFEYYIQFKLFMTGNHMPTLRNVGKAMKRRFNRVPFTVTIEDNDVDKKLAKELFEKEGPQILLWAIQGCVEWQKEGLGKPPDAVKEATESYFTSQDLIGEWISDCCEKVKKDDGDEDENVWVGTGDLFTSWKTWTEARQEFVGSVQGFSMKLEDRGWVKRKNKDKTLNGFVGWKLMTKRGAPTGVVTSYRSEGGRCAGYVHHHPTSRRS